MLVLMAMLVAARRLPVWSPVLFLVGYVSISISLDLLPVAALAILIAFAPLARAGSGGGAARGTPGRSGEPARC